MPFIRQHADVGDVIVGMAGSGPQGLGRIYSRLIFWMQLDETLTFDEYWSDPRFRAKRPIIEGQKMYAVGDRTYRHESGQTTSSQEESMHFRSDVPNSAAHLIKDTSVDRLLVGRRFSYWGGNGPVVPTHLIGLFPETRNHKCPKPGQELNELHALMGLQTSQGLIGDPADWENRKYFQI